MLLSLLIACTSVTIFVTAFAAARHEHAGFAGYVIAILISLLLGTSNASFIYNAAERLASVTGSWSESAQDWCGRGVLVLILLWLLLGAFVTDRLTTAAVRLIA